MFGLFVSHITKRWFSNKTPPLVNPKCKLPREIMQALRSALDQNGKLRLQTVLYPLRLHYALTDKSTTYTPVTTSLHKHPHSLQLGNNDFHIPGFITTFCSFAARQYGADLNDEERQAVDRIRDSYYNSLDHIEPGLCEMSNSIYHMIPLTATATTTRSCTMYLHVWNEQRLITITGFQTSDYCYK